MGQLSFFSMCGTLAFAVLALIDRFIIKIPDFIYLPLAIICIIAMSIGITINRISHAKQSVQ